MLTTKYTIVRHIQYHPTPFLELYRKMIMELLAQLDPQDVSLRKQHRLHRRTYRSKVSYINKLKPYGFAVHGCLDGYVV